MSHHTHIFLSNEQSAEACIRFIDSELSSEVLCFHGIDGMDILGAINLDTGKFTESRYHYRNSDINDIPSLEYFVNSLFSKEMYLNYSGTVRNAVETEDWYKAMRFSKYLDGIKYAVRDGIKWTAKQTFCVNDSYLELPGVSDYTQPAWPVEKKEKTTEYAVIVDFHS